MNPSVGEKVVYSGIITKNEKAWLGNVSGDWFYLVNVKLSDEFTAISRVRCNSATGKAFETAGVGGEITFKGIVSGISPVGDYGFGYNRIRIKYLKTI